MPATRSGRKAPDSNDKATGSKRAAPGTKKSPASKKPKKNGKLEVGDDGEVGLKQVNDKKDEVDDSEENKKESKEEQGDDEKPANGRVTEETRKTEEDDGKRGEVKRSGQGETKQEGDETTAQEQEGNAGKELDEPKHGTLESGHIYFLYRPKIDAEEVESIDDISKFHIVLIPTSAPHKKGHYHRIIEVGKKKMPDPGARHQVIWGLVSAVGSDRSGFKDAFGAYTYETKTRGTRHQSAARPAARGHYILHSPRDELADSPDHNRQRDFKCLLAYEITTPVHEDFGNVQRELGLAEKAAVAFQVKHPDAQSNNNPRAAGIPREKRAHYPQHMMDLFNGRRFIPANPPSFLSYQGSELLIVSSPHEIADALGKDGEKVEHDMDEDSKVEAVDIDDALKELGLSEKDTEIEALEGAWA